jgi:hypothetical protein
LRAKIGDISTLTLAANNVLVAVYKRPEKTKSGIILTDQNRDEDNYQSKVGLVLKVGPTAFAYDPTDDQWGFEQLDVRDRRLGRVPSVRRMGARRVGGEGSRALPHALRHGDQGQSLSSRSGVVMMDIGVAIKWMRHGERVARKGWNGKGMYLALQTPDDRLPQHAVRPTRRCRCHTSS